MQGEHFNVNQAPQLSKLSQIFCQQIYSFIQQYIKYSTFNFPGSLCYWIVIKKSKPPETETEKQKEMRLQYLQKRMQDDSSKDTYLKIDKVSKYYQTINNCIPMRQQEWDCFQYLVKIQLPKNKQFLSFQTLLQAYIRHINNQELANLKKKDQQSQIKTIIKQAMQQLPNQK